MLEIKLVFATMQENICNDLHTNNVLCILPKIIEAE